MNLKKKCILILLLLSLVLLTVSAVSADGSFDNVQQAINKAKPGETIYLNNTTYIYNHETSVEGINISKSNLTIYGGNSSNPYLTSTLDGSTLSRIFNIESGVNNITFIGINFINGKREIGGAIYSGSGSSNNSWENCTFTSNKATSNGGAIYFGSGSSNNSWENCTFTGNKATSNGGAIYFGSGSSNNSWENCTFTGNKATSNGGAIYFGSSSSNNSWENCTFTSNNADNGGAIYFDAYSSSSNNSWENCTFTGNKATSNGGAIYFGSSSSNKWVNCTFTGNNATSNGGAIFFNSGSCSFTDCYFTGNKAVNGSAIYTEGILNLTDCILRDNQAKAFNITFTRNGSNLTIALIGGDNALDAIYSTNNIIVNGLTITKSNIINTVNLELNITSYTRLESINITSNSTVNLNNYNYPTNFKVTHYEDTLYTDITNEYSITYKNITITSSNTTVIYGDNVNITVNLNETDATGLVRVNITRNGNTSSFTANVTAESTKVLINCSMWDSDVYEFTVEYLGDNNYYPCINNTKYSLNITKASVSVNCTNTTVIYGDNVNITVNLNETDATGLVRVNITRNGNTSSFTANVTGNSSKVLINCSMWDSDVYEFTVEYLGDNNYYPCINNTKYSLNITKASVSVNCTNATVVYGTNATIIVYLNDSRASCTVTVHINGQDFNATLNNGNATVTIDCDDWNSDEYTFNVTYSGDGNFTNTTSINYNLNITKANPIPTITPSSVTESNNFTITVTFPNTACGNITVTIYNQTVEGNLTGGIASLNFTALSVGTYNVTVSYSGDGNNTGFDNVNITTLTVTKPAPTHIYKLSADNVTKFVNGTECYTVILTDKGKPVNNAKIIITLNGEEYTRFTDKNGKATLDLDLPVGKYTVTAKWNNYKVENTIIVKPIPHYELKADNVTKFVNGSECYNVTLTDNANPVSGEEIIITLDSVEYTRVTDENGVASLELNLPVGNYTVTAKWNNYTIENTIIVKAIPEFILKADDISKYFKGAERYTVTLTNYKGNPISGETVTIRVNGVNYTRITDENGTVSMAINLNPGTYTVTASWNDLTVKNTITVKTTVHAEDFTKYYLNGTQYEAYVLDSKGNPLDNVDITLNINGVFYTHTAHNGIVKLNINLLPGEYIITAYNDVTGEASSATITVLPTLKGNDLNMTYKDGSKYECKLVDGQGNPVKGAEVTFNIHGVFYHKITDDEGIARLNINLNPGEYIITAIYGSAMTSNTINVREL